MEIFQVNLDDFSGKLLEAATLKHDGSILMYIREKDHVAVAVAVNCHKLCCKE